MRSLILEKIRKLPRACFVFCLLLFSLFTQAQTNSPAAFEALQNKNLDEFKSIPLPEQWANVPNEKGEYLLQLAITQGQKLFVNYLLDNGADTNIQANIGNFTIPIFFMLCLSEPDLQTIDKAVKNGANIRASSSNGMTLLYFLASVPFTHSHKQVLDYSLEKGLAIEGDIQGLSPLHIATQLKKLDAVKALLQAGASIESKVSLRGHPYYGYTSLSIAALHNNYDLVQALLAGDGDSNSLQPLIEEAMYYNTLGIDEAQDIRVLSFFHEFGVKVSDRVIANLKPGTPAHALLYPQYEIQQQRQQALFSAIKLGNTIQLSEGAYSLEELNTAMGEQGLPLIYAITQKQASSVTWLLENGANPTQKTGNYYSIADSAIQSEDEAIIIAFINANIEFEGRSKQHWIEQRYFDAFALYLSRFPNWKFDMQQYTSDDALLTLIKNEQSELLAKVLERGADLSAIPSYSKPLELAIQTNNLALIDLVAKHVSPGEFSGSHPLKSALDSQNYELVDILLANNWTLPNWILNDKSPGWFEANLEQSASYLCQMSGFDMVSVLKPTFIIENFEQLVAKCKLTVLTQSDGYSLLTEGIRSRKKEAITAFIKAGADLNTYPQYYSSPLSIAIEQKDADLTLYLVEQGAIVHALSDSDLRDFVELVLSDPATTFESNFLEQFINAEFHLMLTRRVVEIIVDTKNTAALRKFSNVFAHATRELETLCRGHTELEQQLFCVKNGLEQPSEQNLTQLFWSAIESNLQESAGKNADSLADIIKLGADINDVKEGETALMKAAQAGNLALINELIDLGADLELINNGRSVLTEVGESGSLLALQRVFQVTPKTLKTPRQLRSLFSNLRYIYSDKRDEAFASIEWLVNQSHFVPDFVMQFAAENGRPELVESLLMHPSQAFQTPESLSMGVLGAVTPQREFSLVFERDKSQLAVLDVLVKNGVELSGIKLLEKDGLGKGRTALALALEQGSAAIVQYLLAKGAKLTTVDKHKGNIFYGESLVKIMDAGQITLLKDLFDAGASTDAFVDEDTVILFHAIATQNLSAIKLLLNYGANPDINIGFPSTNPLLEALTIKNASVVKLLLEKGANPNIRRNSALRETPLMLAIENSQLEMVTILLEYKANVALLDSDGKTAKNRLENNSSREIAKLLEAQKPSQSSEQQISLYSTSIKLNRLVLDTLDAGFLSLVYGTDENNSYIELWDTKNQRAVRKLYQGSWYEKPKIALFVSDTEAILALESSSILLIDVATGAQIKALSDSYNASQSLVLSDDKRKFAFSDDNQSYLFHVSDLSQSMTWYSGGYTSLAFTSNDEKLLATDKYDRIFELGEKQQATLLFDRPVTEQLVDANIIEPLQKDLFLMASDELNLIWVWNAKNKSVVKNFTQSKGNVKEIDVSQDQQHFISYADNTLYIWDINQAFPVIELAYSDLNLNNYQDISATFYADTKVLVWTDTQIMMVDFTSDLNVSQLNQDELMDRIAFGSVSNQLAMFVSRDNMIHSYNLSTGNPETTVTVDKETTGIVITDDSRVIALHSDNSFSLFTAKLEIIGTYNFEPSLQSASLCLQNRFRTELIWLGQNEFLYSCNGIFIVNINTQEHQYLDNSFEYWDDLLHQKEQRSLLAISNAYSEINLREFDLTNKMEKPKQWLGALNRYDDFGDAKSALLSNDYLFYEDNQYNTVLYSLAENKLVDKLVAGEQAASLDIKRDADGKWLIKRFDFGLEVFDLTQKKQTRFIRSEFRLLSAAIHPNKGIVYAGNDKGQLLAFDLSTGEILFSTEMQDDWLRSIDVSTEGNSVLLAVDSIQIRDALSGKLLDEIPSTLSSARSAKFINNDSQIIASLASNTRRDFMQEASDTYIFDRYSKAQIKHFENSAVVSVTPNKTHALLHQGEDKYTLINLESYDEQLFEYPSLSGWRKQSMLVSNELQVFSSRSTYIESLDINSMSTKAITGKKTGFEPGFYFSENMEWSVFHSEPTIAKWFNVQTDQLVGCAKIQGSQWRNFQFEPETMAMYWRNQEGQIWRSESTTDCTSAAIRVPELPPKTIIIGADEKKNQSYGSESISSITTVDPSHQYVAMAADNKVRILNLQTGRLIGPVLQNSTVMSLTFSDSGESLAVTSAHNELTVLNSQTGTEVMQGELTFYRIKELSFSDNDNVLSVSTYSPSKINNVCNMVCDENVVEVNIGRQVWYIPDKKLIEKQLLGKQAPPSTEVVNKRLMDGSEVSLTIESAYQQNDLSGELATRSDNKEYLAKASYTGSVLVWGEAELPIFETAPMENYIQYIAFIRDDRFLMVADAFGKIAFYQADSGERVLQVEILPNNNWLVMDESGRYDSNTPGNIENAAWVSENSPLEALPVEVFIRDFFEPRLIAKTLSQETNFPSRKLMNVNRVRPSVAIRDINYNNTSNTVSVTVSVNEGQSNIKIDGKPVAQRSGVKGIALFRNGRQVGYQEINQVAGDTESTPLFKREIVFDDIQLASGELGNKVELSAYAFNEDNIKSLTVSSDFSLPETINEPAVAYVISIGVNNFQNTLWDLNYASQDANALNKHLVETFERSNNVEKVIGVKLTSDKDETKPTKAIIQAIFAKLSGQYIDSNIERQHPELQKLSRVRPQDTVIFTYAGHGYAAKNGQFHMYPWDILETDKRVVSQDFLASTINSDELESMLRHVDSERFLMVIDACNSAASVQGREFRPGPMSSAGLGQLAYNKRMMILTASQAEEFALENKTLKHGLLTFSLVEEGLLDKRADHLPKDKQIFAREWFNYALNRVPVLYSEIAAGGLNSTDSRGIRVEANTDYIEKAATVKKETQQPGIFDFWQQQDMLIFEQDGDK